LLFCLFNAFRNSARNSSCFCSKNSQTQQCYPRGLSSK
jgi:hypothetical protein